jgi:hypothetical protein
VVATWLAADPLHRCPLFALAYGVQEALAPGVGRLNGREVLGALADREARRLRVAALAVGLGREAGLRLSALAAVAGGLTAAAVRHLAAELPEDLGLLASQPTLDALRRAGLLVGERLPAPQPDLLAAALLGPVLEGATDRAGEWLWAALAADPGATITLGRVGRLAYDLDHTLGGAFPRQALADAVAGRPERARAVGGGG